MRLDRVDWPAALSSLRQRARGADSTRSRGLLADAVSLSALYCADFEAGADRLIEAEALEPLNPLHRLRRALFLMRFGELEAAGAVLDPLAESTPAEVWPALAKALLAARQGELKRAANIAGQAAELPGAPALAKLLVADAKLRDSPKGAERQLPLLRADAVWASAVAEVLAKLVLARPLEGGKLLAKELEARRLLPRGSREEALLARLARWVEAPAPALERELAETRPGSRAEELVLALLGDRLAAAEPGLRELRRLHQAAPERRALRRLYVAALTRHAVEEVAKSRYLPALRAVEACLRLEPHETVHHQNRAALFTLLGESEVGHEAWAELDRHHYRLALAGQLDRASALAFARPHRMFASQARLTPEDPSSPAKLDLGVFRRDREKVGAVTEVRLAVNQERLDADPEQLRQWLHHRRAELSFAHLALGPEPRRFLLGPADPRDAAERLEALVGATRSLAVLVPDEGQRLGEVLAARWRHAGLGVGTRYPAAKAPEQARELGALLRRHAETFADLAALCLRWRPDPRRPDLVEELLETLRLEAPFLDVPEAQAQLGEQGDKADGNLRGLIGYLRRELDLPSEQRRIELGRAQRAAITASLAASLLLGLALRTQDDGDSRGAAERALDLVERARQETPASADVEYCAARILTVGRFFDEARQAIGRYHALPGGERKKAYAEDVENLQRVLDKQKQASEKGLTRGAGAAEPARRRGSARIDELEDEVSRFPTSIQLYQELAHALAAEGRFGPAREWSERAMARCLTRQGQLRARQLDLEIAALELLVKSQPQAVTVYLAGSRGPVLAALEGLEAGGSYLLEYLRGSCLLAARRRAEAERAFARALAGCTRQLHLAVLRPLARNASQALIDEARRAIDDALDEGRVADAFAEVAQTLAAASNPEDCLIDLARVQLGAVVATLGTGAAPAQPPALTLETPWRERLAEATAAPDGLERARRLATLAGELSEPSRRDAAALLAKIAGLEGQIAVTRALGESGRLMQAGKWAEALAALAAAGDADPRVSGQRALLLLKLERFAEADAMAEQAGGGELAARYPELACKARIAAASRLLRDKDTRAATAVLAGARAPDPAATLELSYCRAFALAIDGYRSLEAGAPDGARACFAQALDLIEPLAAAARAQGHARLTALCEKLDAELVRLPGGRPAAKEPR